MKKVLIIVGSLRKGSYNRQLAELAEKKLAGKAEAKELDFHALPFLNQDMEYPEPALVHAIREEVKQADLLAFFTPEYNHSIPSQVKNLVDTLSRPATPNDLSSVASKGKKAVLFGVSGKSAAEFSRNTLRELLTFVGAEVDPESFGHALQKEEWISGTLSLSKEEEAKFDTVLADALAF